MIGTISPYIWEQKFPSICGHTSISFLKQCPGFDSAKQGDMSAALMTVMSCVKTKRLGELRQCYPDAVLLPVLTKNKLPMAFARTIGLEICASVYNISGKKRKEMASMERLLHKPVFTGNIKRKTGYILVDDIVTFGGTISALRKHVISCGGFVVAVAALALSAGSRDLTPKFKNVLLLTEKFGYFPIMSILREHNIVSDLYELTNRQIEYLLRFKSIDDIVKKIRDTTGAPAPIIDLHHIEKYRYWPPVHSSTH